MWWTRFRRRERGVTSSELLNDACVFQEVMQGVELALLRPTPSEVPVDARGGVEDRQR